MATKPAFKSAPSRTALDVFLGRVEQPMGRLIFVKDGAREFSQFAYSEAWLADAQYFDISPDLTRHHVEHWFSFFTPSLPFIPSVNSPFDSRRLGSLVAARTQQDNTLARYGVVSAVA